MQRAPASGSKVTASGSNAASNATQSSSNSSYPEIGMVMMTMLRYPSIKN